MTSVQESKLANALVFLACLIAAGLGLWGINADIPLRGRGDEIFYVGQCMEMVTTNGVKPLWTCNPASTLLYPLLAYYHAINWFLFQGGLYNGVIDHREFIYEHIDLFVLVPRYFIVAISVATIPLIYRIGKRIFNVQTGVVGAFTLSLTPVFIRYANQIRSDNIALFFCALSILLMLGLVDKPTRANRVFAASCVGLAVATRYFMAALLPIYILFELLAAKRHRLPYQSALKNSIIGVGLALLAFVITTPFFVLDFHKHIADIAQETTFPVAGADGLSPIENLFYYLKQEIPHNLSPLQLVFFAIGTVLVFARRQAEPMLLVFLAFIFLAGICINTRHWDRWIIPLLPTIVLLTAYGLTTATELLAKLVSLRRRALAASTLTAVLCCWGVYAPALSCVKEEIGLSHLTTNAELFWWIYDHIPPGTHLCRIGVWEWGHKDRYLVKDTMYGPEFFPMYNKNQYLPPENLNKEGFDYFIVRMDDYNFFRENAKRYPRELRFYDELISHCQLVHTVLPKKLEFMGVKTRQRDCEIRLYKYVR